MLIKDKYIEWLENNPKGWSNATVDKYESAVRMVSKEMLNKGVISKDIYDMCRSELDVAIFFILHDIDFQKKDKTGNKMYSNGLKQYRTFVVSTMQDINSDNVVKQIENEINNDLHISITEREAIISARVGQGVFRKQIIEKYGKCVITGVDNAKLLIASHVKPWAQSNNDERISVNNGLLLTPTFDKLFDYGLITFTERGKLITSTLVGKENEQRLHIPTNEIFCLCNNKEMINNMQYHRDVLFVR